jgi:hypothetical protein
MPEMTLKMAADAMAEIVEEEQDNALKRGRTSRI